MSGGNRKKSRSTKHDKGSANTIGLLAAIAPGEMSPSKFLFLEQGRPRNTKPITLPRVSILEKKDV